MLLFLFFTLIVCAHGEEKSIEDLLVYLREIKEKITSLEVMVSHLAVQNSDTEVMTSEPLEKNPVEAEDLYYTEEEQNKEDPADSKMDVPEISVAVSEKDQERELDTLLNNVLEDPLNKNNRRWLKSFFLRASTDALKSKALFFLGEIYYLRNREKDRKKALHHFSRSYSLEPKHNRAPKTLMRIAQCLAKENKIEEAKSIVKKIKSEYSYPLSFDLEKEFAKVSTEGHFGDS